MVTKYLNYSTDSILVRGGEEPCEKSMHHGVVKFVLWGKLDSSYE